MSKQIIIRSLTGFMLLFGISCANQMIDDGGGVRQLVWELDSLNNVAGHPVEVMGNPQVVSTDMGEAILFDGDGDRLLVDNNPVSEASEFTIEIIFTPNDVYPNNAEPRFFHVEGTDNPDRRITIELRLNDRHEWYLDAFIKSDISKFTLVDETLTHPVGEWAHAAITYKDRVFTSYVNGVKELSAEVDFLPISDAAKTSVGARMNQIHWFNGAINRVAVTHRALPAERFVLLPDFMEKRNP